MPTPLSDRRLTAAARELGRIRREAGMASFRVFAEVYLAKHFTLPMSSMHGELFAELQTATTNRGARLAVAEIVEEPRDGASVAPALRALPLELVYLLDRVDGDNEIVVLEFEDGVRIVKKNVCIEDVVFLHRAGFSGSGRSEGGARAQAPRTRLTRPATRRLPRASRAG